MTASLTKCGAIKFATANEIELVADDEERAAVARRLGLDGLESLRAHAMLAPKGAQVGVTGRIVASLSQHCVVTGDPVPARIDEPFSLLFVPEPQVGRSDEEIELGSADCDVVFYDGASIDLGAAIADTLALSLDPYPRSAGAQTALKEIGILTESEAGPFAALAQLKKGTDSA